MYLQIFPIYSGIDSGYDQLVFRVSSYGGGEPNAPKHGAGHSSMFEVGRPILGAGLPAISVPGKRKQGVWFTFQVNTQAVHGRGESCLSCIIGATEIYLYP